MNGNNSNTVRREAKINFRRKKKEHLKNKINEPASRNKNKNIRNLCPAINEFNKSYRPRTNLIKD
jgi:hypothetical protein